MDISPWRKWWGSPMTGQLVVSIKSSITLLICLHQLLWPLTLPWWAVFYNPPLPTFTHVRARAHTHTPLHTKHTLTAANFHLQAFAWTGIIHRYSHPVLVEVMVLLWQSDIMAEAQTEPFLSLEAVPYLTYYVKPWKRKPFSSNYLVLAEPTHSRRRRSGEVLRS